MIDISLFRRLKLIPGYPDEAREQQMFLWFVEAVDANVEVAVAVVNEAIESFTRFPSPAGLKPLIEAAKDKFARPSPKCQDCGGVRWVHRQVLVIQEARSLKPTCKIVSAPFAAGLRTPLEIWTADRRTEPNPAIPLLSGEVYEGYQRAQELRTAQALGRISYWDVCVASAPCPRCGAVLREEGAA